MSSDGPLSDVTVVELAIHRAGPFCGALLADMGAEVIKIERPGVGDPTRTTGPGPEQKAATFMALNRNKKSATVNLKTADGKEALHNLIKDADVFIENFGHGVAERLNVGYEELREINEDIVYASIKGYGKTGPLKEKKGLDLIMQAEGGIMSVTGSEGGSPVKVGQAIGDIGTAMFSTIGILARLHERDASDDEIVGQFDIGLFDTIVSFMNEYSTLHSMTGEVFEPQGTSHQTMVPYQLFETKDAYIVTGVPSDERWDDFVDMLGREEIRQYQTNDQRLEHKEEVTQVIQEEFEKQTTEHWQETLTEHGFPCGPLNDIGDVVEHEQVKARDLIEDFDDPDWGTCKLPGFPLRFPDYDTTIDTPAPTLGEHTDEVFSSVAKNQSTLDQWREGGAFDG